MEHTISRPDVLAASAIRGFLKAIVCGLLVLSLITALLELQWPYEKSLDEHHLTQALAAPVTDCALHTAGASSHCQQSQALSLFTDCVISCLVFRSILRFSILDAMARLQHRPDSPLRPPTPFSSIA